MHFTLVHRQSGAVLVIALVFLVILTLLGITGAQNTILEERMAGNYRDRQIAHEVAEAAMQAGFRQLDNAAVKDDMPFDGSAGTHDLSDGQTASLDPFDHLNNVVTVAFNDYDGGAVPVFNDPNYYIEKLAKIPLPGGSLGIGVKPKETISLYRVTARGWGMSDTGVDKPQVILQGTFFQW